MVKKQVDIRPDAGGKELFEDLPGWTVNHASRKVLKISLPVKKRAWMDGIFSQIQNSRHPLLIILMHNPG